MRWRKSGLIFQPEGQREWMSTHSSAPVARHLGDHVYRVYFSSRDLKNRSHVGYVELDLRHPAQINRLSNEPVLRPGPLGYFDDHGVYASSLVEYGHKLFMYYIGWNPGARGPLFYSSIGLAISEDGGRTFSKYSKAPVMARSEFDPCLVTAPFVLLDDDLWRMWYVSGFKWVENAQGLCSYYHVKYAESRDGINWNRDGLVCIDLRPEETNIGRPCVIKGHGLYQMWYSYSAKQGYRMGYAESEDGYVWTRKDEEAGLGVSSSGWDSQAVAYPCVFSHEGIKHMLYNGNQFGKEGFGLAIEEQ